MAKTNFTKVEEVLEQGLRKYTVDHLLEEADAAAAQGRPPSEATAKVSLTKEQEKLVRSLQFMLKRFPKKDHELYSFLAIKRSELKKLVENPKNRTENDWALLKQIKQKADQFKTGPQQTDETLIESERKDHINRRYNINKKWLPLT